MKELSTMPLEVAPGIFEIDTKPLGQEQIVASYVVKGGGKTALIDPGFPMSAETVIAGVEEIGIVPEKLDYIILTHTHIDHAGGAGRLAQVAKGAIVITHTRGVFYLKNSGKISGGAKMVFDPELSDEFGETVDISGDRIQAVGEGDSIDLGDKRLMVSYTPGHAGNHISLFEETTGTLFPGDTCCLNYPQLGNVLIPAGSPPIYPSEQIVKELQNFFNFKVKTILTPHYGKAVTEPSAFIEKNIECVNETRQQIEKLFSEGLEFPQVIEQLRNNIIKASGKDQNDIPDFLTDVWLRVMLKTGLMGYMADILQYAKDISVFHESK